MNSYYIDLAILLPLVAAFVSAVIVAGYMMSGVIKAIRDYAWNTNSVGTAYEYVNSKGTAYYLHLNKRLTKTGKVSKLYFFSLNQMDNAVPDLPDGYTVVESINGVPTLKLTV